MGAGSDDGLEGEFDEAWYLGRYADVAAGVAGGHWKSGYEHYRHAGRYERGRYASARHEAANSSDGAGVAPPANSPAPAGGPPLPNERFGGYCASVTAKVAVHRGHPGWNARPYAIAHPPPR